MENFVQNAESLHPEKMQALLLRHSFLGMIAKLEAADDRQQCGS